MNRRLFLNSSCLALFSAVFPVYGFTCKDISTEMSLIKKNLQHYFFSLSSAEAIGKKYLSSFDGGLNLRFELQCFLNDKYGGALSTYDNNEFSKVTEKIIRNDFKQKDTCIVDGWLLSITEANLCALCVLIES